MIKKHRFYTSLGLFVTIGFLLAASLIYFFNFQLHSKSVQSYVMFFDKSLKGLEVNSPVTYRGVKIGYVKHIELTEEKKSEKVLIPVYVNFYTEQGTLSGGSPVERLIKSGWSAGISKPNLITGVADIELVEEPGKLKHKWTSYNHTPLFPTVAHPHKVRTLDQTLQSAEKLLKTAREFITSKEFQNTVNAIQMTAISFKQLANSINSNVPSMASYINQALKQISQAAYSTKNLTDYLEQNPESLLRGKRGN